MSAPEVWHGVQAPPVESAPPLRDRIRGREPAGLARPMPDLGYLPSHPRREEFAEAIAQQIADDAMPDHRNGAEAGYPQARRNALALMTAAWHISGTVHDNYPAQDLDNMVVFERWSQGKFGLRSLQRIRAAQLGALPAFSTEID